MLVSHANTQALYYTTNLKSYANYMPTEKTHTIKIQYSHLKTVFHDMTSF